MQQPQSIIGPANAMPEVPLMNTHRSQLYLAHSCDPRDFQPEPAEQEEPNDGIEPEDAAEYISALLGSLRSIASKAQLRMLSDLLYVAEEEARLHCRA
jgi:hypothetical protein